MTSFRRDLHIKDERDAQALSLLSACYAEQERLADALKVQQQAVNVYREANGSDSTEALTATAALVKLLNQEGSFVRSELLLGDALQISQRKQVCDVEATALLNDALADTLLAQNKTVAALKVLEELQPIDESYMRLKQRSVDSADKLAALYEQLGRSNLSRQTLEQGLVLKQRILGAKHPQVLATQRRISERDQTARL
jgi:tetratricopeptide (TPR) repeat protein